MNKSGSELRLGEAGTVVRQAALARLAEVSVSALLRVPPVRLRSSKRGRRPVARARQMAMYLAHVGFGLTYTRIGICFGRDRSTVRHACTLIEDRRDDPALDLALAAAEAGLVALGTRLGEAVR